MPETAAEETLGYVLFGVFFSLWFSGILSYQTVYFYTSYPNERKWLKAFVGTLVLVDWVQTVVGVAMIWDILIKHFSEMGAVKGSTRLFQIFPVLVGLISSSVQIFFAWRIKVLSANLILFLVIVVLAIPQFAGGIAYTILTVKAGYFTEFWNFNSVIIGWVASSVVCDIVITIALTMILRRHRANQNLGAAADLVQRIKTISIHNGLVTIIWSLALLIALATGKHGAHYMFFYPLGKVYLITMLASLNSRPIIRPELDPRIHSVLQRSSSPRPNTPSLHSHRGSTDFGEKSVRPISRISDRGIRFASRTVEYLPVTQEEREDVPRAQTQDGRPSNESADEVQPLVQESPPNQSTRPPRQKSNSVSSRPRGPRLPAPPSSVARSLPT